MTAIEEDHGPGCDGPLNCTCQPEAFIDGETWTMDEADVKGDSATVTAWNSGLENRVLPRAAFGPQFYCGVCRQYHDREQDCDDAPQQAFYVEVRGQVGVLQEGLTYDEACTVLNAECDRWEREGFAVDRSWASSGNYMAAKGVRPLSADRFISVELADG